MKKSKMSLSDMKGKLTRTEMKKIMAGSNLPGCIPFHGYCDFMSSWNCCDGMSCVYSMNKCSYQ